MDLQARILQFVRRSKLAVIATNSGDGPPESALVGIAVSPGLELIFDTTGSTRKAINLRRDPRLSAVIGWESEETLQYEGLADEPTAEELDRVRDIYFQTYPDGRSRLSWSGLTHFRVRPVWVRFTSYLEPECSGELRFD